MLLIRIVILDGSESTPKQEGLEILLAASPAGKGKRKKEMSTRPQSSTGWRRTIDVQAETNRFSSLAGHVFRATGQHPLMAQRLEKKRIGTSHEAHHHQQQHLVTDDEQLVIAHAVERQAIRQKLNESVDRHTAYLFHAPLYAQREALKYAPGDEVLGQDTVALLDTKERVRSIINKFQVSDSTRRAMCTSVEEWAKEAAAIFGSNGGSGGEQSADQGSVLFWDERAKQMHDEKFDESVEEVQLIADRMQDAIEDMRDFGHKLMSGLKSDEESRQWQNEVKQRSMKHQSSLTDFVVECSLSVIPQQQQHGGEASTSSKVDDQQSPPNKRAGSTTPTQAPKGKPFPPPGHFVLPREFFSRSAAAATSSAQSAASPQSPIRPTESSSMGTISDGYFAKEAALRKILVAAETDKTRLINAFRDQITKLQSIVERYRAGRRHEKRQLKDTLESLGFDMPWAVTEDDPRAVASLKLLDGGSKAADSDPTRVPFSIDPQNADDMPAGSDDDDSQQKESLSSTMRATGEVADDADDAADFLLSNIENIVGIIRMQERRGYEKQLQLAVQHKDAQLNGLQQQVAQLQQQLSRAGGGSLGRAGSSGVSNEFRSDENVTPSTSLPTSPSLPVARAPPIELVMTGRDVAQEGLRFAEFELSKLRQVVAAHETEKLKRLAHISDLRKEVDAATTANEMVLGQLREKERELNQTRINVTRHMHQQIEMKDREIGAIKKDLERAHELMADAEEEAKKCEERQDKEIDVLEKANESFKSDIVLLITLMTSSMYDISNALGGLSNTDDRKQNLQEVAVGIGETVVSRCCAALRQLRELPSLRDNALTKLYVKVDEGVQFADLRLQSVRDVLLRVKSGEGVNGVIADLRAQLQAALLREEESKAAQKVLVDKHAAQLVTEQALRDDLVNMLRTLQNSIGALTRVANTDQLRTCELVLPFCGPAAAATRRPGTTAAASSSPSSAAAEAFLSQTGEIAIAAFAAVKHRLWKVLSAKADGDGVLLDNTPLTFHQALTDRIAGTKRLALNNSGIQEQLRLMRFSSMTQRCFIAPVRKLIRVMLEAGATSTDDPALASLLDIFAQFEVSMRGSCGLVLTGLVRLFKFEHQWVKIARQSTLLSTQCSVVLDRLQFAFNRTEDVDTRRQVSQRLAAIRKHQEKVVANVEKRYQQLALTYEDSCREAGMSVLSHMDRAVQLLRDSQDHFRGLLGERLGGVVDEKTRLAEATARLAADRLGALISMEGAARHVLDEWSGDATTSLCVMHKEACSGITAIEVVRAESMSLSVREEAATTLPPPICVDVAVNTHPPPVVARDDRATQASPPVGVSSFTQCVAADVTDREVQTDPCYMDEVTIPQPLPQFECSQPLPRVESSRRSSVVVSSSAQSSPTSSLKVFLPMNQPPLMAERGCQTEEIPESPIVYAAAIAPAATPEATVLLAGPSAAVLDTTPPPGTPVKMARHRRQLGLQSSAVSGGEKVPVVLTSSQLEMDLSVHGTCPRYTQHHVVHHQQQVIGDGKRPPVLESATTQTDVQLLFDYVATLSKMMLPITSAPAATASVVDAVSAQGQQPPRTAPQDKIPSPCSPLTVMDRPEAKKDGPWHSFFKSRRPVSAKR